MNIAIFIYPQAEVLDFSGPFEVFSTAKRLGMDNWNIFLVAETEELVTARGGYRVIPHYSLENHPPIDLLIVVGGVHTTEMHNTTVLNWIRRIDRKASIVASVCTGAFFLANAGLLDGLTVTTHHEDIPELTESFPLLKVISDKRWVREGKYLTSGGISAGIDMSLYLVSQLQDETFALEVAFQMEYHW